MVTPLERKLLRDLGRSKGQVITLALVVGGGIASFVGPRSTYRSLQESRAAYYERYRFADVFARAERVPEPVAARGADVPGVARVYTRVVEEVRLPQPGALPGVGRLVSIPDEGPPPLNALHLRAGRLPERHAADEVVLLEAFAIARVIRPGDHLTAVINGRERALRVVGIALSPEYVYAIRPGALSDERGRFAIVWMRRSALAAAYDAEGSFNDLSLQLQPGAPPAPVLAAVDQLLAPYGGSAAVERADQVSHRVLESEFSQLQQFAGLIAAVFLGVSAFLVNVVLSRMVALQRREIAALKALGYRNAAVGAHYLGVVAATVLLGAALGLAAGVWFGWWMTDLYGGFFRFPVLAYRLNADVASSAILVSLAAACVGALLAVRSAVRLPPAEAMRPPAPPVYRVTLLERLGLGRLLGPAAMMIARELVRRPLRTALSAVGVGAAVGVLVLGRFSMDSFEHLLSALLLRQQREDVSVTLVRAAPARAVGEVRHMPGVLMAEGMRMVPAGIAHGPRAREIALVGLERGATLRRLVDRQGREATLPAAGLLVTTELARLLGAGVGAQVEITPREGQRRTRAVPISGLVDEAFGLQAYLPADALAHLMGEEPQVSVVLARLDSRQRADFLRAAERSPAVLSVDDVQEATAGLREQTGKTMRVITAVITTLAMAIAVGVVYNNARIALSQRSRELATLRVLGFTRREISAVMMGELAVQVVLGLPLGVLFGRW